jgi:putative transposase
VVNTFDEDAVKRRQRAQQVTLFRYQLICPALEPGLSTKQRGKVVRGIAGRSHDGPFGGQVRYSRDTLDRWIRRYRAGGFDALSPSIRQPRRPDRRAGVRPSGSFLDKLIMMSVSAGQR